MRGHARCFYGLCQSSGDVERLDGAILDLRGCCAAACSANNETKKTLQWCVGPAGLALSENGHILELLGRKKLALGTKRPHHTGEGGESLEKELGLNACEDKECRCGACSNDNSSENVKLRLCTCCRQVWRCSRERQTAAWRASHKGARFKGTCIGKSPDEEKAHVDEASCEGIVCSANNSGQPAARSVARGALTGRCFESLSDVDMLFLPLELGLAGAALLLKLGCSVEATSSGAGVSNEIVDDLERAFICRDKI